MTKLKKFNSFVLNWGKKAIFKGPLDGLFYIILYLALPIIITSFSLKSLSPVVGEEIEAEILSARYSAIAYCYFTILVSAAGCIYDAACRWEKKSIKVIKLSIIILVSLIIFFYSLVQAIGAALHINIRQDLVLIVYGINCFIAIMDGGITLLKEISISDTVKANVSEIYKEPSDPTDTENKANQKGGL